MRSKGNLRRLAGGLVFIALSACGGDAGNPIPGTGGAQLPVTKKGQFIDSQVSGLDFQTARRSGITDGNGTFDYDSDGEIITFSIGSTVLGTARANSIVHVFDVAGQSQISDNSRGERLAQLLQTLDEDGNASNGIQLSPATKAVLHAQPAIDFAVTDAAWNTRITAVASSTFKVVVPMAQAVSHAQANQPASSTCTVADATYPLADIDNLGKFSTAGRTCDKKARSMAFYEDINAAMLAAAAEYRNSQYIADGETIAQKDVETLAKNNLVNNSLNLVLDHIAFLDVKGKTSAETFAKVLSNSAKLTKDIVTWSTSLACNIQGTCANPQEFAVKMTAKVADVVSKTSACFTGKPDKCADAIKTSADINDLLKLSYGDIPAETVSKLADFTAAWVGVLADGWDAVNDGNLSDWTAFAGSLADTAIKTKTNYYTRSDDETAHRSASANAFEITGEVIKVFTTCYLPKTPLPTEVVKHYAKCAGEGFTYLNQRSAEIGSYFFMILTVQDLLRRADDMDVARTVLSEWHHYDGMTGLFAHYGIAKPASDAEVRRSLEKLLPVIATKIGLSSARYVVGGTLDSQRVIDTIFLYFRSVTAKSQAILAGKFTSCRSVELGEIDSPQFIRDARYPYLIAVQTNTPINFAASYTPSPAVVGYDFNFGNGTSVTSDLPAANFTYSQTNGYNLSVTPIIKSVDGGIRSCESKRRVVAFRAKDMAPKVTDVQPKTATIGISTTFTVTGANLPVKAVMSIADAVCVNPPAFNATGFTVACTLGGAVGAKVVTVKTDTLANGGIVINATQTVTAVTTPVVAAGLLPDTGITASQCYGAGSNLLISCTSAAAIALNSLQDGMVGRDVANNSDADGKAGFSYSVVPDPSGISGLNFPKTACVKDNITGLVWEGKPADGGYRDFRKTYTNYGDGRIGDASAYVAAVNAAGLCGATDWLLPTVDELQGIVNYGVAAPGPSIDATWFPNTQRLSFLSSSPYVGDANNAWAVDFTNGHVGYINRANYTLPVRLVRAGQ